jgi:O-antigen ligase
VNYATFSAQSSYNRILIWQFGTAEVARHPIFGIGMGEWERPRYMSNSMDNFWLVQAVRYGLPGLMLLLGSFFVILKRISRLHGPTIEIDHLRRGVIFSVLATMITIFSVHLWNASYVWLMLVLGAITWLTMPVGAASADDNAPLKT